MDHEKLRAFGWKPFFEQQVSSAHLRDHSVARVSAHHGSHLLLLGERGEFRVPMQLARSTSDVAVGDWLLIDDHDNRVVRHLERETLLYRKASGEEIKPQIIAANIDTIFIVSSCNEDFNLSRIERYLALVLQSGAFPVVVLSKADITDSSDNLRQQVEALHPGLLVETLDARNPEQAAVLNPWCQPGKSIALLGSSGVGKSTLANSLGADSLATAAIREKDGKGRHTTTARSLHLLPSGGVLVDNPGMRELQLPACEDGVSELFEDVLLIAERCRFSNCSHSGDVGCAVEAAIKSGELEKRRFASFMKLNAEQARNSRSLAEHRQRDRQTGRLYKSIIAKKRRRRDDAF